MMKAWFLSKITWIGIIQTLIGALALVSDFISKGSFQPQDFVLLVSGILTVILRIWFTNTTLSQKAEGSRAKEVEVK